MPFSPLFLSVKNSVSEFKKLNDPVRIVASNSPDGVISSAILIKTFLRSDIPFSFSFETDLNLESLSKEDYSCYFFLNTNSHSLNLLSGKKVFIFDHSKIIHPDFIQINPNLFGLDSISSSALVYLFSKSLSDKNNDLIHLALLGSLAHDPDFVGLNELLLNEAKELGVVETSQVPYLFLGLQTKSLSHALEYSSRPFVPFVAGSKKAASSFLKEASLPDKKVSSLSEEDLNTLVTALLLKNVDMKDISFKPLCLLVDENDGSSFKDLREFLDLVSSLIFLSKTSTALGACLGNRAERRRAEKMLVEFRTQLVQSLNIIYSDLKGAKEKFVVVSLGDKVNPSLFRPVSSVLAGSFKKKTIVLMADFDEEYINVHIKTSESLDSVSLLQSLDQEFGTKTLDFLIPYKKELEFIAFIERTLEKLSSEERVQ